MFKYLSTIFHTFSYPHSQKLNFLNTNQYQFQQIPQYFFTGRKTATKLKQFNTQYLPKKDEKQLEQEQQQYASTKYKTFKSIYKKNPEKFVDNSTDTLDENTFLIKELKEKQQKTKFSDHLMSQQAELQALTQSEQFEQASNNPDHDKFIIEQIKKGKSDEEILKMLETFETQSQLQQQSEQKKHQKNQRTPEEQQFEDQFSVIFDKKNQMTSKHLEELDKLEQIQKQNPGAPQIPELPYQVHSMPNRKLTVTEKSEINIKMQNLQHYLTSPGAKIQKKYPDYIYEGYYAEEGDKNRLSVSEKKEKMAKIVAEVEEKQNVQKIEKFKQNQKKDKIIKMKLDSLDFDTVQDDPLKKKALADQQNALEQQEIGSKQTQLMEKQWQKVLSSNSFTRSENIINQTVEKYSGLIESPEIRDTFITIQREDIFAQKKLQEEQKEYAQYLKKKEQIRLLKQYDQQLHFKTFKENLDLSSTDDPEKHSQKKLKKKDKDTLLPNFNMMEDHQKLEENIQQPENIHYIYRQKRTLKNVENYVFDYFYLKGKQITRVLTHGSNLEINQVIMNESLTVVNIFWRINDDNMFPINQKLTQTFIQKETQQQPQPDMPDAFAEQNEENSDKKKNKKAKKNKKNEQNLIDKEVQQDIEQNQQQKEIIQKIQQSLDKFSSFFSGKLCKDLGFKYGPEVRFYYSNFQDDQDQEIEQDVKKTMPDVVKSILSEDLQINTIQKPEFDRLVRAYELKSLDKIYQSVKPSMSNNNLSQAKEERKKQLEKNQKLNKTKRDSQGNLLKPKHKKGDKANSFWDKLEA